MAELDKENLDLLVYWMRERHKIHEKKSAGQPWPWTKDDILQEYKFTNPFRENDRTTVWFRDNIREPLRNCPTVLFATIMFRWFNFIPTGEVMLSINGQNGLEIFRKWKEHKYEFILAMKKQPQVVNGCYVIKTPTGMDKLDGIVWCLDQVWEYCIIPQQRLKLKEMHEWLQQFKFLGPFMAYEIVTDLRHTYLLENAPDIMTWANPGPGAQRGLNRLFGREVSGREKSELLIAEMRTILPLLEAETGFDLEMRDVEHSLCEFDKYCRVYFDEGKTPKQRYRHATNR